MQFRIDFNVKRDPSLDIALSNTEALQRALSSIKHGYKTGKYKSPINIRDVMYGSFSTVKTVAIHMNSTRDYTEYVWYSKCNVYMRDVCTKIVRNDNGVHMYISILKLDLYSIDIEQMKTCIDTMIKDRSVLLDTERIDNLLIYRVEDYPCNVLQLPVRITSLNCSPSDWKVTVTGDTTYTIFKGDKFINVLDHCDVVLSTDANITVKHAGRIYANEMYSTYLSGDNVNLLLATVMFGGGDFVRDYSSIFRDNPLKGLAIREQVSNLVNMAIDRREDDLQSRETRLMLGVSI
jgi:hypothetical protein